MPCNDVTEAVRLTLDAEGRLVDYELRKLSCGAEVGHPSLLRERLGGLGLDAIVALDGDTLFEGEIPADGDDEFLVAKHLVALQEALAVLSGDAACGPTSACAASRVTYDDGALQFEGILRVELLTERIKACGSCGGCRRRERPPKSLTA